MTTKDSTLAARQRRYNAKHKDRVSARRAVGYARKKGRIPSAKAGDAHHASFAKGRKLDVVIVNQANHTKAEKAKGRGGQNAKGRRGAAAGGRGKKRK
jgi:hypothetical protein